MVLLIAASHSFCNFPITIMAEIAIESKLKLELQPAEFRFLIRCFKCEHGDQIWIYLILSLACQQLFLLWFIN